MMLDTFFGFESADAEDSAWIARILEYRRTKAAGLPHALIDHVKKTKVGREIVVPVVGRMTADRGYRAKELGDLIGLSALQVRSKLAVLGRPESRLGNGQKIFQRAHDPEQGPRGAQTYSVSHAMQEALTS